MNTRTMSFVLAALLILVMVLYFGLGFFGDSVVENDEVGSLGLQAVITQLT